MCVTWKGTPNSLPGHLPRPYSNASHTEPWPWHIHHRRGQLHVISMPFASCPLQAWPTYQCHESIRQWHLLTSPIGRLGCVPVWDASCKPMAGAIKKELPTTIKGWCHTGCVSSDDTGLSPCHFTVERNSVWTLWLKSRCLMQAKPWPQGVRICGNDLLHQKWRWWDGSQKKGHLFSFP